jgi:hypothetical protein
VDAHHGTEQQHARGWAGVVRSPLSGERLTEYLLTVLEAKGGPQIRPNYMLHKKVRPRPVGVPPVVCRDSHHALVCRDSHHALVCVTLTTPWFALLSPRPGLPLLSPRPICSTTRPTLALLARPHNTAARYSVRAMPSASCSARAHSCREQAQAMRAGTEGQNGPERVGPEWVGDAATLAARGGDAARLATRGIVQGTMGQCNVQLVRCTVRLGSQRAGHREGGVGRRGARRGCWLRCGGYVMSAAERARLARSERTDRVTNMGSG